MLRAVKPGLFLLSLGPAVWLVARGIRGDLGVNPAETLQLETGLWALRFLLLTLAVTPVRRLTGWNRIIQYRRMLGLFAFFYGVVHMLTYVVLDLSFALGDLAADVAKRPFITLGFLALLSMVPLALTSTRGWIRRLGRQWQTLHRLVYASGLLAVLHYAWKVKVFTGSPVRYAAALGVLLAFRAVWYLTHAKSFSPQRVKAAPLRLP